MGTAVKVYIEEVVKLYTEGKQTTENVGCPLLGKRNVEEGKEEKGREMKGCFIMLQNLMEKLHT